MTDVLPGVSLELFVQLELVLWIGGNLAVCLYTLVRHRERWVDAFARFGWEGGMIIVVLALWLALPALLLGKIVGFVQNRKTAKKTDTEVVPPNGGGA